MNDLVGVDSFIFLAFHRLLSLLLLCDFLYSQIDVSGKRKAVVIYVPYRLQKAFRKIHLRLVGELEKKFSGKVSFLPDFLEH